MALFPDNPVQVVGGGLAGAEACWQLARRGVRSVLFEMRPETPTPAHRTRKLAELVCSNSFRSDDAGHNAVGLLHEEMRRRARSSWPAPTARACPRAARSPWTARTSPTPSPPPWKPSRWLR